MKVLRSFSLPSSGSITIDLEGPGTIVGTVASLREATVLVEVVEDAYFSAPAELKIVAISIGMAVPSSGRYIGSVDAVHYYEVGL